MTRFNHAHARTRTHTHTHTLSTLSTHTKHTKHAKHTKHLGTCAPTQAEFEALPADELAGKVVVPYCTMGYRSGEYATKLLDMQSGKRKAPTPAIADGLRQVGDESLSRCRRRLLLLRPPSCPSFFFACGGGGLSSS